MFDGAALVEAAAVADAHHDGGDGHGVMPAPVEPAPPAPTEASAAPAPGQGRDIYVIDQGVAGWQQLVAAVPAGGEVVLVTPESDGVAQLAAALQGRSDIASLSIFSHGEAGQLHLGGSMVDAGAAVAQAAQWQAIGAALGRDADILLYGCDLARDGTQLLQRLAELTGADVAASVDATGAARAGGDWTLEAQVGAVETGTLSMPSFDGLLAVPAVTTTTTAITVIEASANNAAGVSSFAFASGWSVADGGNGAVTVTVSLNDSALGRLENGIESSNVALSFNGSATAARNWLNTLRFNATENEIGNRALSGTLSVAVSATDADGNVLNGTTRSIAVTVTPSSDPATLSPVGQSVTEGATTAIAVATLGAFDPEVDFGTQVAAQLVYKLNAEPQHGYLTLNGARLGVDSIFTQADVIAGRLAYVHTATGADQNLPDAFTVRLNDGATPVAASDTAVITLNIAASNLPPTVSGTGSAYEGQPSNAAPAIGSFIVAGDGGDNEDPATLRVLITALPGDGTLYFDGVAVGVGFEFAYGDRARLTYANLNSREPGSGYPSDDSFGVLVFDGGGGTGTPASTAATIAITVRSVNDDPVLDQANAPLSADVPQGTGVRSVVLKEDMFQITDVDSTAEAVSIVVTNLADLSHGQLQLAGKTLTVGSTFTLAQLRAGQVRYVQTYLAGGDLSDTFRFQVVDNATSLFWDAAGVQYARAGGVHAGSGAASPLRTFDFTVGLDQTADPDYDPQPATPDPTPDPPGNSASKVLGADASLAEGGAVVLSAASLSYSVTTLNGIVDPQQILYTVASLDGGPAGGSWNGTLQRWNGSAWVALGRYDSFTQADLNAGNGVTLDPSGNPVQPAPVGLLRYVHDGASEDFESTVTFSVSAGVLVDDGSGNLGVDRWEPTFAFHVTPVNDLPTVTGSTSIVIREGGTAYITTGELAVADADDAITTDSAGLYEAADTLPGGGTNYAYNNGAGGGAPLRFQVTSLPAGGTLESSSDHGATWTAVTAGQMLDASLLTGAAATTGLRFVSDGLETRQTSFQVRSVDRWDALSATTATVTIQVTNVNDPPAIAARPGDADPTDPARPGLQVSFNEPLHAREGTFTQITSSLLQAFDPDSTDQQVQYRITAAPAHGSLAYSTNGTTFTLLGTGSAFTKADVDAGRIYYVQRGNEPVAASSATTPDDKFVFTVADGDKEQTGNEFWIYFDPLANDAPVVSVTSSALINIDSAVAANNPVAVFQVNDPDLGFVTTPDAGLGTTALETDFLQVTVRLLNGAGTPLGAAAYAGVTLAPGAGAAVGVDIDGDGQREHTGNGDYLVLSGTRAAVQAALSGLTLAFADDRDALYRVQVIADDRLRDADGVQLGTGANGGAYNQPASATASPTAVPSTEYNWYTAAVPTSGAIAGNLHSTFVQVRASSVNDAPDLVAPATLDIAEDTLTFIGAGFGVSDAESAAFSTPVSVTLGVNHGTLYLGAVETAQSSFTVGSRTVTASGDGSAAVTLTGLAADIDALLKDATRGLRYQAGANVNGDMNAGADGDVTLTMSFDDSGSRFGGDTGSGSQASNGTPKQVAITLVPVNDAPVLSGTANATVRENAATGTESVRLLAGGDVSDVDLATTMGLDPAVFGSGSLTVSLTGAAGYRAGDILFVDLDPAALPAGVTVAGGVGTALTVSFDADTTLAQVRTVLNALAYRSSSDNPAANGTDPTRSYRIEINDGNNAQPGGDAGGPAQPSNALDGVLTLEASNDPPVAVDDTHSINEDSVFVGSNVISGRVSAEADSDLDNPLSSLRISAVRTGTGGASTDGTAAVGIGLSGSYGVLRLDADGTYRYDLDNGNALVQQLGPGQTLTDTFSYTLADTDGGTSTAVLRITINGTDDAPVAQDDAATVDEDTATPLTGSVRADDTPGDGTLAQHTVAWGGEAPAYGAITRNADGSYGYALDNANPLVQQLAPGQTLTERFTYTLADADGDTSSAELVITIRGTDDLPVAVDDSRTVDEDTATPLMGSVRANDTPGDGTAAQNTVTWGGEAPAYGTISRHADGTYSYALDNANALVQQLAPGQTLTERFTYTLADADGDTSSAELVITIRGTDDLPVAVDDSRTVDEDDAAPLTGSVKGNDTPGDGTLAQHTVAWGGEAPAYGTISRHADGTYSYALDNANPAVQQLAPGQTLTERFTYTLTDADGDASSAELVITIRGTDDLPVAVDDSRTVDEDDAAPLTGSVKGNDTPGDGTLAQHTVAWGGEAPAYGTISRHADGTYSYALDNANPAVQQLAPGQTLTERFTYTLTDADGDASGAELVITIHGTDDLPVAAGDSRTVDEDDTTPLTGSVRANDTPGDGTASQHVVTWGGEVPAYGTLTRNADGSYSYALDNANALVQQLAPGQTLTERFTYTLADADGDTSSAELVITIRGTDDLPVAVNDSRTVDEDDTTALTGSVKDNDTPGDGTAAQNTVTWGSEAPAYGTISRHADGTYSYALDNANPLVQQLAPGQTLTERFTYTLADADSDTSSAELVITIRGTDDLPVAVGDSRAVDEDDATVLTGSVKANDTPGDGTASQHVVTWGGEVPAYGTLTRNADGSYSYALDNANPRVQQLAPGQTLTERFTYTLADVDGDTSSAELVITIRGTDDLPVAVNDSRTVDEDDTTALTGSVKDNDTPGDGTAAQNTVTWGSEAPAYGTISRHADGTYSYALDNANPLVQQLAPGQTLTERFTYTLTDADGDASGAELVITIHGTDDLPVAVGDSRTVDEDDTTPLTGSVKDNDTPGDGTAAQHTVTWGGEAPAYGAITRNADGSYGYALDNANPLVQQLAPGQTLTERLTYTLADADGDTSSAELVITIRGTDDLPVAVNDSRTVDEDDATALTGSVKANDTLGDGTLAQHTVTWGGEVPAYGTITRNADGSYGYALDNANPAVQQLGPGQTLTERFTYTLTDADGDASSAELVITIRGTDDLPVAVDDSRTVDEDDAAPLTGSVKGNDTPGDGTAAQNTVTWGSEAPAYGTISRHADGTYSYVLDNANPLVQQLAPGQTLTERFTYTLTDADGDASGAELVITIRGTDDLPVAVNDSRTVDEDDTTPLTGSVRANDTPGDGTLVQHTVAWGGEAPAYGTISRHADGTYSYVLDNANPLVQRLVAGETLVERFTYTLADADGDTRSAELVITIRGTNDGPALVIDDGNGGAIGQATVAEQGLAETDGSQATQGRFIVSAPDGLQGVSVGGTFVSAAQLATLGNAPLDIATARGVLTLTGYDAATGTVSYRYVLSARQDHADSGGGDLTDDVALAVLDRDGDRAAGTLRVLVLDDAPLARDDAAQLGTALPHATASGNLLGGAGRGDGDVADRFGADAPVAVAGFAFEGRNGGVGAGGLRGQYGTLRVEADGRYVYAVDDAHPAVAALGDGKTLTERFTYTIRDADGSTSTATLVVTIRGNSAFVKLGDQIFPVTYEPQQRDIAQAMAPGLFVQHAVRDSARESLELAAGMGSDLGGGLQSQTLLDDLAMSHTQHVSRDGVAFSRQMEHEARLLLAQRLHQSDLMAPGLLAPLAGPAGLSDAYLAPEPVPGANAPQAAERFVVPRAEAAPGAGTVREVAAPGFSRVLAAQAGERAGVPATARGAAVRVKVHQPQA